MKYAHRLFCHVWLLLYMFRMDKCILFVYILQGCFNGTGVIFRSSPCHSGNPEGHYGDVIKSVRASEITNLTIVYSTVYSGAKKTSKLRVTGLCEGNSPVTCEYSPYWEPVTRKMFPFDDVIMIYLKPTTDELQQSTRKPEPLAKFVGCILYGCFCESSRSCLSYFNTYKRMRLDYTQVHSLLLLH